MSYGDVCRTKIYVFREPKQAAECYLIAATGVRRLLHVYGDVNPRSREELALPLRGKKSHLRANDFWHYLAAERLGVSTSLIERTQARFAEACAAWPARIEASFLSPEMKARYLTLLEKRRRQLSL